MQEKGYISMVLHAHLPYVRHPEYKYFLEENWLFEAINETYIPLLSVFETLWRDGVNFKITMSLTPTLLAMLSDPLLQERYVKHIDALIELADKEVTRTQLMSDFNKVARMYLDRFNLNRNIFVSQYNNNLINGFKKFQDLGNLEIITCCATHGFLPLMSVNSKAVEAQIKIAVDSYERHLGRKPRGIWLAECGYFPGHDEILKKYGIQFFFTDTHGVLHASPRPKYGVFAPVFCNSGVAAFGRDVESSRSVWSMNEGYPGDYNYREFYRDVGFDLDLDYIKPYIHPDGIRINTGIKYYKITGKTNQKEIYNPEKADYMAKEHAANFHFNRVKQVEHLGRYMDRKPLVVSPYDAELFGHWWYEGPKFIEYFL
jgi:1,4-alpha-glucan branching enzyme